MSVSNCCLAEMASVSANEGTTFYVCMKCQKACEPAQLAQGNKQDECCSTHEEHMGGTDVPSDGELEAIAEQCIYGPIDIDKNTRVYILKAVPIDHKRHVPYIIKSITAALTSQRTKYEAEIERKVKYAEKVLAEFCQEREERQDAENKLERTQTELRQAGEIIEEYKADNERARASMILQSEADNEAIGKLQRTIEELKADGIKAIQYTKDEMNKAHIQEKKVLENKIAEVARLKKQCVHCQSFPDCRKNKSEPFYGVLDCGCTACNCKGEDMPGADAERPSIDEIEERIKTKGSESVELKPDGTAIFKDGIPELEAKLATLADRLKSEQQKEIDRLQASLTTAKEENERLRNLFQNSEIRYQFNRAEKLQVELTTAKADRDDLVKEKHQILDDFMKLKEERARDINHRLAEAQSSEHMARIESARYKAALELLVKAVRENGFFEDYGGQLDVCIDGGIDKDVWKQVLEVLTTEPK